MAIVGKEDFKIVVNKFIAGFLYSLAVLLTISAMAWILGGGIPVGYSFLGSLAYAGLEALLKFFRKYKPEQYEEFKWIYEIIFEGIKKLFK